MNKKITDVDRFYSWSLVTYALPLEFQAILDRSRHYAYIYHNADGVEPHYHILLTFEQCISLRRIRKIINSNQNTLGQPIEDRFALFTYLTHENLSCEGKAVYDDSMRICDNLKYWCSAGEPKADNKQFVKDLFSLSILDLGLKYGKDFIKNRDRYLSFKASCLTELSKTDIALILDD